MLPSHLTLSAGVSQSELDWPVDRLTKDFPDFFVSFFLVRIFRKLFLSKEFFITLSTHCHLRFSLIRVQFRVVGHPASGAMIFYNELCGSAKQLDGSDTTRLYELFSVRLFQDQVNFVSELLPCATSPMHKTVIWDLSLSFWQLRIHQNFPCGAAVNRSIEIPRPLRAGSVSNGNMSYDWP